MDPFAFSEKTMEYLEKMVYMKENFDNLNLGQVDKVKFQSINEMDIDSDNIPDQWNIVQKERVELSISEGNILVNNINDDTLGSFQTRNINFEAGKNYRIELALDNQEDINVLYLFPNCIRNLYSLKKQEKENIRQILNFRQIIKQRILLLGSVFQRIHR